MTLREEMHRLTQEIIGSFEERTTAITSLRDEVATQRRAAQGWLKDAASARQVAAQQQRADLNRGRADHQAMARQQRADLSKGHADLRAGVGAQLQELDREHNAMARQQRADLNRGRADHQAMARQQRADLSKGHADLRAGVGAQLQELDREHNAMAQELRDSLAKVHVDLNRAEAGRKSVVKSWMEDVAAAHGAAREEWLNLSATMQTKRAGAAVAEAPPEVAPAAAVEEAPEEDREEAVEVGEVTEELASLGTRVFEYLASHPDGTRLTELEQEFGLGRFQAARVVRHLMNEGKAEKRDLLYFAI